jgi:hypothetical protein
MELLNSGGDGGKMQFFLKSGNNDFKHKRFDRLNSNKK